MKRCAYQFLQRSDGHDSTTFPEEVKLKKREQVQKTKDGLPL